MTRYLGLPNTFVLLFAILALIALATWLVPGGQYDTHMVNGRALVDPASFHYMPRKPQGPVALMMAPIKGFVEAALIIGFVLIVGGAFAVLQKTEAIDSMIKSVARAHTHSAFVRAALIPVFVSYRLIVWFAATAVTIAFLMWYAARIKRNPCSARPSNWTSTSARNSCPMPPDSPA